MQCVPKLEPDKHTDIFESGMRLSPGIAREQLKQGGNQCWKVCANRQRKGLQQSGVRTLFRARQADTPAPHDKEGRGQETRWQGRGRTGEARREPVRGSCINVRRLMVLRVSNQFSQRNPFTRLEVCCGGLCRAVQCLHGWCWPATPVSARSALRPPPLPPASRTEIPDRTRIPSR